MNEETKPTTPPEPKFETTYRISLTAEGKCECGHTGAAHGSNGYICCVCGCKRFVLRTSA